MNAIHPKGRKFLFDRLRASFFDRLRASYFDRLKASTTKSPRHQGTRSFIFRTVHRVQRDILWFFLCDLCVLCGVIFRQAYEISRSPK